MSWSDLQSAGYTIVPGFLDSAAQERLRDAYATSKSYVIGTDDPLIEAFRPQFNTISKALREATDIEVDTPAFGSYVAIDKGTRFGWQDWHQDALTWYLQQDNYHYVNVYLPIIKPEREKSNMYVVPFNRLQGDDALLLRLRGGGARRARCEAGRTILLDDQDGGYDVLPCNLQEMAVIPELAAGDLLVMRGDLFHRTQDVETDRVAVSFRLARASTEITRRRLAHLCLSKLLTLTARGGILTAIYQRAFDVFEHAGRASLPTSLFNPLHAQLLSQGDPNVSGEALLSTLAREMQRDDSLRQENVARLTPDVTHVESLQPQHQAVPYLRQGIEQVAHGDVGVGLTCLRAAQLIIASLQPDVPPCIPRSESIRH